MPCRVTETDVWVAKDDGSDLIRAAAIVSVGVDYGGNVTVLLAGGDGAVVTVPGTELIAMSTDSDFHRR